jgi:hypothetical protein
MDVDFRVIFFDTDSRAQCHPDHPGHFFSCFCLDDLIFIIGIKIVCCPLGHSDEEDFLSANFFIQKFYITDYFYHSQTTFAYQPPLDSFQSQNPLRD